MRQQAIIGANKDPDLLYCHVASLGHNRLTELMTTQFIEAYMSPGLNE